MEHLRQRFDLVMLHDEYLEFLQLPDAVHVGDHVVSELQSRQVRQSAPLQRDVGDVVVMDGEVNEARQLAEGVGEAVFVQLVEAEVEFLQVDEPAHHVLVHGVQM